MAGQPLTLSGHHHGAVRALLPLPPPAGGAGGPPHLWSASDDGTIFAWSDAAGDGVVDEAQGRSLTSSGGKASAARRNKKTPPLPPPPEPSKRERGCSEPSAPERSLQSFLRTGLCAWIARDAATA